MMLLSEMMFVFVFFIIFGQPAGMVDSSCPTHNSSALCCHYFAILWYGHGFIFAWISTLILLSCFLRKYFEDDVYFCYMLDGAPAFMLLGLLTSGLAGVTLWHSYTCPTSTVTTVTTSQWSILPLGGICLLLALKNVINVCVVRNKTPNNTQV